ncbi:T9SS type A sorting domain-containing protein [Winogradskyella helgolandensis]|uniref:T9SS type A sorting domain-containing protein n=1 Tax=Winogradskyella helgolandensis TaxID=2697010 RepID=UPI0015BC98F2|nr:T9SS type A sorting domain-containing protein [Winogradskyella helgolandensis]
MRKITLYFMMLLSITAFAQVEIVENFNNVPDFELPTDWTQTGDFLATPGFVCDGSGKALVTGFEFAGSATVTTQNYTTITNDTDLTVSFSVNILEQATFWPPITFSAPAEGWGSVVLEYSLDGGVNWITAYTIDDSNYTFNDVDNCYSIPVTNLGALTAGSDFQARFVATATTIATAKLFVVIDNISMTQIATEVPNCDTVLLNPVNGSASADLNTVLTWEAATGLPTGYAVSVGTTSGGTEIVDAATTATTSYSLDGLGLVYETEYFVNIVPFNGIGSATGCTEESFTTRLTPIPGATCSSPIDIATLPYIVANDDTANYENNINVGPCGGYPEAFMTGNDVFYQISPDEDMSIDISLANVSEYAAAIHVMEGCPDTSSNCVATLGDNYASAPPYTMELTDVVLLAGHSYFIVLSRASYDGTFSYSMIVTQNECINPEFTVTPVAECDSGEFSVDVDISYLGDALDLTLADNFGYSNDAITSTGIVNVGPYPTGTTVEFTLTNNGFTECSYSDSIYFYCPPSNDDCVNSTVLTINTDGTCTIVTSATNAGASESTNNPINCDFTNSNDVWFSFEATKETIILEYSNIVAVIGDGGIIQATELLEGTCGSFTSLACVTSFSNYITLNNLTVGNTYYIRNSSANSGEYAQNFDICLKEPPAAPANDECANATVLNVSTDESCDNQITGTTVGATISDDNSCNADFTAFYKDVWYVFTAPETGLYKLSFERTQLNPSSYFSVYSGTCGALVEESTNCYNSDPYVLSATSGESYYVMVRSGDDGPGIDFDLCIFKLPPPVENDSCATPTVLSESTDANGDNMISGDFANSYPSSESCASSAKTIWYSFTATQTGTYHFNLTNTVGYPNYTIFNTDDCSLTANNYVAETYCYNSGERTVELVGGNTYLISIFSFDNNTIESFDLLVYPDATLNLDSNTLDTFKYYPNPIVNTLTIEATSAISNVSVHNIVGQKVQMATPNSLETTINMEDLISGVYFVTITTNGSQNTIKVVKK